MKLTLIAALARNLVIGYKNCLPWHLPEDLRFFKKMTMGKTLLMGRHTWESISRLLPGRHMIVLSSDPDYHAYGCSVASSLEQALGIVVSAVTSEIIVIGGASVFKQTLPLSQRLYLTRVDADLPGDTWFPYWNPNEWRLIWEETYPADNSHAWSFRLQKLERIHHINNGSGL